MTKPRTRVGQITSSLLARFAIALGIVGLIPLAFVSERLIALKRDALIEQVEVTHSIAARTAADRVGAFLQSRTALAASLARNPALSDPKSSASKALLRESVKAWSPSGVLALVVVDAEGHEVVRAQVAEEDARRAVAVALEHFAGPSISVLPLEAGRAIRWIEPLPSSVGAVWVISRSEPLREILHTYELGEDATLGLVDENEQVLAGNALSLDQFPREMLELSLTNRLSGVKPSFRTADEEGSFIGAFASVPHAPWAVLSRQPTSIARRVERDMRRQEFWILGLTLILVSSIAVLAYRGVLLRLRKMIEAQKRLVGPDVANTGDVIGDLEKTFAALARNLDDKAAVDQVFLGRYQVVSIVGRGSMGTVFEGWDPKLRRPVALKTIRLGSGADFTKREQMLESLLQEAVTAAGMRHPNIVAVYDVEDRPEAAYIAMEFVDGTSLARLLWKQGACTVGQSVALSLAIADALAHAHSAGIAHRDIKPGNILLGRDNSIKVTDFGIAEIMESARTGDVLFGTPGYLAPEALTGRPQGPSGDIFAIGAVLYYCLTGVQPFRGKNLKETIERSIFATIQRPRELDPDIPEPVDNLVMRLLEKDPKRRPQHAGEILDPLRELVTSLNAHWTYRDGGGTDHGLGSSRGSDPEPSIWVPTRRLDPGDVPTLEDDRTREIPTEPRGKSPGDLPPH